MKKLIGISLISLALLGCTDDSDDNSPTELSDQFEGIYINESTNNVNSAIIANDDQGDFLLIDFVSNIIFVPLSFSQTPNSIDYNQYKEGALGSWTIQTGSYGVDFSGNTANSEQLGVILNKTTSESLVNIAPDWNVVGSHFTFTSSNSITYSGYLEFDSDGYWELNDDLPFTDSSGQMVASNAEIIVFIKSGKTYSVIYDKQLSSVIAIDVI
ncbi:hypothetical protein HGG78_16210 [Vibrio aestuarianus]|uniref:hypothetical protein n=1 Tax=Vibrio aestuarianus TaxID=28171 RepID=UPI0015590884|nr:hypothetical protein [Vibrio aestuarianus]NGZ15279.1 hypothetical protein [Vibrio aestuarianus]NKZ51427.1 hypothetical protein [Vibrio aestuarianus]